MSLFKKDKSYSFAQPEAYPGAPKDREALAKASMPKALERLGRAGESYPGQLVAPLSSPEKTGIGILENYLQSPLSTQSKNYKLAQGELEKTLSGNAYDPVSGTYYQAYRNNVLREIQNAKDRLAATTSASDKYFGGGRISGESDIEQQGVNDLMQVLGSLYENERQNRLNAVSQAGQMARSMANYHVR